MFGLAGGRDLVLTNLTSSMGMTTNLLNLLRLAATDVNANRDVNAGNNVSAQADLNSGQNVTAGQDMLGLNGTLHGNSVLATTDGRFLTVFINGVELVLNQFPMPVNATFGYYQSTAHPPAFAPHYIQSYSSYSLDNDTLIQFFVQNVAAGVYMLQTDISSPSVTYSFVLDGVEYPNPYSYGYNTFVKFTHTGGELSVGVAVSAGGPLTLNVTGMILHVFQETVIAQALTIGNTAAVACTQGFTTNPSGNQEVKWNGVNAYTDSRTLTGTTVLDPVPNITTDVVLHPTSTLLELTVRPSTFVDAHPVTDANIYTQWTYQLLCTVPLTTVNTTFKVSVSCQLTRTTGGSQPLFANLFFQSYDIFTSAKTWAVSSVDISEQDVAVTLTLETYVTSQTIVDASDYQWYLCFPLAITTAAQTPQTLTIPLVIDILSPAFKTYQLANNPPVFPYNYYTVYPNTAYTTIVPATADVNFTIDQFSVNVDVVSLF